VTGIRWGVGDWCLEVCGEPDEGISLLLEVRETQVRAESESDGVNGSGE